MDSDTEKEMNPRENNTSDAVVDLQMNIVRQMCCPTVTIHTRKEALYNSNLAAQLQPQLPPYELSFWTDASLKGRDLAAELRNWTSLARKLIVSVVHRRWDIGMPKPSDWNWMSTWWLSGFVAPNVANVWEAEALGIVRALMMALNHCERISGVVVTTRPNKLCEKRISCPMPMLINVFSDNTKVLRSLGGLSDQDEFPRDKWLIAAATDLITSLGVYGVRVNLQWVPGHSGDIWNGFAHEGSRMALDPKLHHPKVYRKDAHRVFLKMRRGRRSQKVKSPVLVEDEVFKQEYSVLGVQSVTAKDWCRMLSTNPSMISANSRKRTCSTLSASNKRYVLRV